METPPEHDVYPLRCKLVQLCWYCNVDSTAALLEYKASLPSNKRGSIAALSRQRFLDVYHNKALILHDTIDALDRSAPANYRQPR